MNTEAFRDQLLPGERLLWTGRPRQGLCVSPEDLLLIPFSLLWGGFAIFWETSVIRRGAPGFFAIWGIPFVLVGLYLIAGRFFADAYLRAATWYAVTDQRILLLRGGRWPKLTTLPIDRLAGLTLSKSADERGTIAFGASNGGLGRPEFDHVTPSFTRTPCFFGIEDPTGVFGLIERAARAGSSRR